MAAEVEQYVDASDDAYSDTNFAYGSTPYSSFNQVMI